MNLVVLIPLSIGLGLVGLCAFFWALCNNQFDDPDGAAWRVISPEHPPQADGKQDGNLTADTSAQ